MQMIAIMVRSENKTEKGRERKKQDEGVNI